MTFQPTRRETLTLLGSAAGSLTLAGGAAARRGGRHEHHEASLTRFAEEPLGAEVTGLRATPEEALFLNVQHPSADDPAPYDTHAVGAIVGIDGIPEDVSNLPVAETEAEKRTLRLAAGEHQVLANGGDAIGDGRKLGVPVAADGTEMALPGADMNVFVPTGENEGYLFTNWEGQPGMISRMRLDRADDTAEWEVGEIENLDVKSMAGTWNNCNGWRSPWNTPLSSEEYPADAEAWFRSDEQTYGNAEAVFEDYLGHFANAYRYGYVVEVEDPAGEAVPTKRFALGRLSHEVALTMPDERTVYLSDDWGGGVFCKFVADEPGDLSRGTLYAAKLHQDATDDPTQAGFDVKWIELAHADEAEIESWIAEYDDQDPSADDYEPDYVTDEAVARWADGDAADDRAAFLETRKAAAAVGATAEWQKLEGLATRPDPRPGDFLYVACSNIHATMSDGQGDIQLQENKHGAVYAAKITGGYDIRRLEPALVGGPDGNLSAGDGPATELNTLWSADNLDVLGDGRVLVGEDGDRADAATGETLDFLWLLSPKTGVRRRHRGVGCGREHEVRGRDERYRRHEHDRRHRHEHEE